MIRLALPTALLIAFVSSTGFSATAAKPHEIDSDAFEHTAPKERKVTIKDRSAHRYAIEVGGTADMDNTITFDYWTNQPNKGKTVIGFQNNLSLTVENTGSAPVVNPRIVTNDRGRWWSIEAMAKEATRGATTDTEKALFIWDFCRRNSTHAMNFYNRPEHHDPVRHFNIYGQCLCGDIGWVAAALATQAKVGGGEAPHRARLMNGHVMCELYVDGKYRFIDTDEKAFFLDFDNETLTVGDDIARDHYLMAREPSYCPNVSYLGWKVGGESASLLGRDDNTSTRWLAMGHRIDITLRPGEKLVYRWADGPKEAGSIRYPLERSMLPNSLNVFTPKLTLDDLARDAVSAADLKKVDGGVAGATRNARLVIAMPTPYALCGGRIEATLSGSHDDDAVSVHVSQDGKAWKEVWSKTGRGQWACRVDVTDAIEPKKGKTPKRTWFVRIDLASAGDASARLTDLTLTGEFINSPFALPRLRVGENAIEYTDETKGPHEVTVTHRWRESGNVDPPPAPALTVPADGDTLRTDTVAYRWRPVEGATLYHIEVSRYEDFRLPYRPALDMQAPEGKHEPPFKGMYNPETDYYWRVRARSAEGLWGPYSEPRRFRWAGPCPPVDVTATQLDDGRWRLDWSPNPRGERPVKYEVYGSDQRGFIPSKVRYHVSYVGGWQDWTPNTPANFLGATEETSTIVVAPDASHANMNRSHYRVIAIDKRGTSSGPSPYAEVDHPYIYTKPVTEGTAGEPYRYEAKTVRSIGDLQFRQTNGGPKPHIQFFERER